MVNNFNYDSPVRTTSKSCPERPVPNRTNKENITIIPIPFPFIGSDDDSDDDDETDFNTDIYDSPRVEYKKKICPERPYKSRKRKILENTNLPQTLSFDNLNDLSRNPFQQNTKNNQIIIKKKYTSLF